LTMSLPATRMNLLACRDRMALAVAGVDLLKSKREAFISDFFRIVDTIIDSREEMAKELQQAMIQAGIAKSFAGSQSLAAAALSARRDIPITIREINIWGIHIPEIHFVSLRRTPEARGMLPIDTSPHVLEAAESYEKLLDRLLRTANHEIRLKRLGEEIRKVSRRINALEQSLIPTLSGQVKQILATLQEREREDLFRLKHIKSKRTQELGR
jgi:V/A-type H+-transporting ATPase subunit D